MDTLAITGLFSPLGRRMARLASQFGVRVLGIDIRPMTRPFAGIEFVEADIRNPLLSELFKTERVDTVLHCSFRWRQRRIEEVFDSNVLGTMRLLGAAAVAGVKKVIIPSSTLIYGANANNPTFLSEESEFVGEPQYAYIRELREIENFVKGYRRQQSDMVITMLRFANILGGGIPSPMTRYLALPAPPVALGYEPMMQFIDHDDALRVLGHCIMHDFDGVYNIAAPDPIPLLKVLALAGVVPFPTVHLLAEMSYNWGHMFSRRVDDLAPMPWNYLRYPCVAATERMVEELAFTPSFDGEQVVRRFGEALSEHRYDTNTFYRFTQDRWSDAVRAQGILSESRKRSMAAVSTLRGEVPEA